MLNSRPSLLVCPCMLILVLCTLWGPAMPHEIDGKLLAGGDRGCCSDAVAMYCDGVKETQPCTTQAMTCIGLDGDGFCVYVSKSGCYPAFDCENWDNESCD